jgi:hypothetical protein
MSVRFRKGYPSRRLDPLATKQPSFHFRSFVPTFLHDTLSRFAHEATDINTSNDRPPRHLVDKAVKMVRIKFVTTAKGTGTTSPVDTPAPSATASPAVGPKATNNAAKPFQVKWNDESHTALLGVMVNIVTNNGAAFPGTLSGTWAFLALIPLCRESGTCVLP